jgi:twinkle protein
MKYQSSNTKQIHNIEFKPGRQICPECSHLRKKKGDKCLEYYPNTNSAYCWNCNTTYFEYKPYEPKQYKVPDWKNITELSDKAVKYFESRMIKQETLVKMKVYSDREFMPQLSKESEVICFPYFLDNQLKNIKYRGANKSFKLVSGAELIFWNIDCLKNYDWVIITEGEIDALSYINSGFDNTLSVPNGANNNLEYLDNYIHLFDPLEKIYLAVDQDTKGIELRDEFIRRFGAERCKLVSFKECKDANEYVLKYSGLELRETITNAKECPIKGLIRADNIQVELREYFETGIQKGKDIKFGEIDKYITWETGRLAIVTGVPSSGKSEFVDYLVSKLNLIYKWKAAYFTPENYPLKYHYSKLYEKLIGKGFSCNKSTDIEYDIAYEHISENFFWILNEDDLSIDKILESAKFLVKTKGIKILVIDPYNKVEHQYDRSLSETQYVSKFLDKIITFEKLNDILIFLIAHPRKMNRGDVPTLYDISGSANFYNKADYGFTVHRMFNEDNIMTNEIQIHWQKIKFKHLGEQGISELRYNYNNGRFETGSVDHWDNTNWLIKYDVQESEDDIFKQLIEPELMPF